MAANIQSSSKQTSGQGENQPNAVNEHQKEGTKNNLIGGKKKPEPIDQSKEDNSETKLFRCQICQKAFSHQYVLKLHIRIHTGEKPYECQVCKKAFIQLSHLKSHSGIHTGEKPYECQVCKKTFIQLTHLRGHSRIHTGEKPYECRVCEKTFTHSNHLRRHGRIHTGEKPYECQVCKKTFSQLGHLKSHSKGHAVKKSYECQVCQKIFTQAGHLKSHSRVHAKKEKLYECQVCKKTFSHSEGLKNNSVETTTCPPCAKMRCEGLIGSCSGGMDSSLEIELDPDYVLAAGQAESDIDEDYQPEDGSNEDPAMFPRPIKEEIIESEVDSTELVTEDEHFVFLDEKIEIKSEADETDEDSAAEGFGVTVKQEVECSDY